MKPKHVHPKPIRSFELRDGPDDGRKPTASFSSRVGNTITTVEVGTNLILRMTECDFTETEDCDA